MQCAEHSLPVQEPMIASTLVYIHRWVLVEQRGEWLSHSRIGDVKVGAQRKGFFRHVTTCKRCNACD